MTDVLVGRSAIEVAFTVSNSACDEAGICEQRRVPTTPNDRLLSVQLPQILLKGDVPVLLVFDVLSFQASELE
jgi:hypothetical protein